MLDSASNLNFGLSSQTPDLISSSKLAGKTWSNHTRLSKLIFEGVDLDTVLELFEYYCLDFSNLDTTFHAYYSSTLMGRSGDSLGFTFGITGF